ncbi:uncharacterized protein SCHCODRAFT_02665847 [Schizophyllum commune H4-8]|uniref:uncharacterized protein n=1 Tax=Schizophyllum commune (strain H4-8 / FGSC 9210) TaxID=578458 RepID=UPI0021610452|nr:uncharacterized protein SCHCODRAFT_02665847 [Schizophyllum commune H4-8]KAI5895510.1 hypothetical protein SCHCODRAFT_02665847 [Schizophyllum commune H4-8]
MNEPRTNLNIAPQHPRPTMLIVGLVTTQCRPPTTHRRPDVSPPRIPGVAHLTPPHSEAARGEQCTDRIV